MGALTPVVDALQECVAIPSPTPPGDVAVMADWVDGWAQRCGAEVRRQHVEPGRDNVLTTLSFGLGPRLVFNTHLDVNDPSDQHWTSPPFQPIVRDGRLYGRGACDAKGSLVAMLAAMERLAARPTGLRGELLLTAVMGEEAGGVGSLHLVRQGLRADGAVVGEPTELRVACAHKGTYMRRLRVRGRAAHSGQPARGVNAVTHAAALCMAYDRLNARLAARPHPLVGPPTAAVTVLHGGTRQNTIPDLAELIIDRRLVPGETHADADAELADLLDELRREWPALSLDPIETVVSTVPSETPRDAPIVRDALAAMAAVTGLPATPDGFSAGCDMSKLVTIAGIPTVICGPGSLAQAHTPDEYVDLGQVEAAVRVYEGIARRFLEGPD